MVKRIVQLNENGREDAMKIVYTNTLYTYTNDLFPAMKAQPRKTKSTATAIK